MSIPKVLHYCWFGGAPKPKNIHNIYSSGITVYSSGTNHITDQ